MEPSNGVQKHIHDVMAKAMARKQRQGGPGAAALADEEDLSTRAGAALRAAMARSGTTNAPEPTPATPPSRKAAALQANISKALQGARERRVGWNVAGDAVVDGGQPTIEDTFRHAMEAAGARRSADAWDTVDTSTEWNQFSSAEQNQLPVDLDWMNSGYELGTALGAGMTPEGLLQDAAVADSWSPYIASPELGEWSPGDAPVPAALVDHSSVDLSRGDWNELPSSYGWSDTVPLSAGQEGIVGSSPIMDMDMGNSDWQQNHMHGSMEGFMGDPVLQMIEQSREASSAIWAPPADAYRETGAQDWGRSASGFLGVCVEERSMPALATTASTASTTGEDLESDDELLASCFAGPNGIPDL